MITIYIPDYDNADIMVKVFEKSPNIESGLDARYGEWYWEENDAWKVIDAYVSELFSKPPDKIIIIKI